MRISSFRHVSSGRLRESACAANAKKPERMRKFAKDNNACPFQMRNRESACAANAKKPERRRKCAKDNNVCG